MRLYGESLTVDNRDKRSDWVIEGGISAHQNGVTKVGGYVRIF